MEYIHFMLEDYYGVRKNQLTKLKYMFSKNICQ